MPAPRIPRIPTYGRVPEIPTGVAVAPLGKPPAFAPGSAVPAVMRRTEPTRWLIPPPGAARLERYSPHDSSLRQAGETPSLLSPSTHPSSRAAAVTAPVIALPARRR